MKNFSKWVVKAMIVVWFLGAAFGAIVVTAQLILSFTSDSIYSAPMINISDLLNYIGMPVSGAIIGYLVKSAFENKEKIKSNPGYFSGGNENMF